MCTPACARLHTCPSFIRLNTNRKLRVRNSRYAKHRRSCPIRYKCRHKIWLPQRNMNACTFCVLKMQKCANSTLFSSQFPPMRCRFISNGAIIFRIFLFLLVASIFAFRIWVRERYYFFYKFFNVLKILFFTNFLHLFGRREDYEKERNRSGHEE